MSKFKLSVAFDFGSRYSGYAYSLKENFEKDPTEIYANKAWNAGENQLLSIKTPTCILIDDQQKLCEFGFEAENRYKQLMKDNRQCAYYYFEYFKMTLYESQVRISYAK